MNQPIPNSPAELAHPTRAAYRWNLVLSLVLLVAIAVFANVAADRHLGARFDLSADGLHSISDATRSIVGKVEDRVTVRLYATEDIEDGQLALRTARIRSQLDEFLALRPGAFELQSLDPSRSSEAGRRAAEAGFRPQGSSRSGMGRGAGEPIWLSLELGYRGRTERIAAPSPWQFEIQFASALHALQKDRRVGVGWLGARIVPAVGDTRPEVITEADSTFRRLRQALEQRARLVSVGGLERGKPVPDDVDVLFIVRPPSLPDRAVFEIDQFVQRGGRLIVCLDDPDYNLNTNAANYGVDDFEASKLGEMLRSWGIRVAFGKQIWDGDWQSDRAATVFDRAGKYRLIPLRSPMVVTVPPDGFDSTLPPVQGIESVQFAWAHPIVPEELAPLPPGIQRSDFIRSSGNAWIDDVIDRLPTSPQTIRTRLALLRQSQAGRHTIAGVFGGRFPSPWAGMPPPPPEAVPGFGTPEVDERPVLSAETPSQIVVIGDADWLRDPGPPQAPHNGFVELGGKTLALNLVDWLTLDEALIGLRSRAPKMRPLRDFLSEEAKALGVFERDPYETEAERRDRDRKMDVARARSRRKEWLTMLMPAGLALVIVLGIGALGARLSGARARAASTSERGGR